MMRKVGLHFSVRLAKRMLRFSMPVVPSNLASLVVNASDRYFIKVFFSMAEAGIYSLGYKLGNVVFYLVRVPFMQIWSPRSYAIYSQGGSPEIFAKVCTYFTGLMIFCGLGIAVFVNDIIKLISPSAYWSAGKIAPAVVLCYIVYALDTHVGFGIMVAKKTEYWTIVNLIMGGINIGLNFLLIPRWGMWGAVLATLISLVFKISALYSVGRRYFNIPFEWGRMAIMLGIAVIIYFVRVSLDPGGMILALCLDAMLALGFPVVLWGTGVINHEEKESAISLRKLVTKKALSFVKM
jgi:O-antigen/teichoic acid export membrane protein